MNKKALVAIIVVAVLAIAGGVFAYMNANKKDTNNTTSNTTTTTQETKKESTKDGNATVSKVLDAVKSSTSTVTATRVFTEATDPNNALGKQGQYQYAGAFYDSRTGYKPQDENYNEIDIKDDKTYGTTAGGSIEVYANDADAKKRGDYLAQFQTGAFSAGAYKVVDNIVLRASENYTASQQTEMLDIMAKAVK